MRSAKPTPGVLRLADRFFKLSPLGQRRRLIALLQMIQASITIRSFTRTMHFISMEGGETADVRYDRLLKRLFGMAWKEKDEFQNRKTPEGPNPRAPFDPVRMGSCTSNVSTKRAASKRRKQVTNEEIRG